MKHSERVAGHAMQILKADGAPELSDDEKFLLLCGIYLHDIGMQCDAAKNRRVYESAASAGAQFCPSLMRKRRSRYTVAEQKSIRANHSLLSAAWVDHAYRTQQGKLGMALQHCPKDLVDPVMAVCKYHTTLDIQGCPTLHRCSRGDCRLQMLAAVLRLADELDIDSNRVNIEHVKLFSLPPQNELYWWLHNFTEVRIEHVDGGGFVQVSLELHPEDCKAYGSLLAKFWVDAFDEKNRKVFDSLACNGIAIGLDRGTPQVVENSRMDHFPKEMFSVVKATEVCTTNAYAKVGETAGAEGWNQSVPDRQSSHRPQPGERDLPKADAMRNRRCYPECRAHLAHDSDYLQLTGVPADGFVIEATYQPVEAPVPIPFRQFQEKELELMRTAGQFNGNRWNLADFWQRWERINERPVLQFHFWNSSYLRFNMVRHHLLDERTGTDGRRYMHDVLTGGDPAKGPPILKGLAHSFGINLLIVSADNYALFVRRGKEKPLVRGEVWGVSVNEGLRRKDEKGRLYDETSPDDPTPSIATAAVRGTWEETRIDISDTAESIKWVNFGINWALYQPALLGYIRDHRTKSTLNKQVPLARDYAPEISWYEWVLFDPESVVSFLSEVRGTDMLVEGEGGRPRDRLLYFAAACAYFSLLADAEAAGGPQKSDEVVQAFSDFWKCPIHNQGR